MSDSRELIRLIQNRDELNEKDEEKYFNKINNLIKQTEKFLKKKYDTFDFLTAGSIITEEDFLMECWGRLEGTEDNENRLIDSLQLKLNDIEFQNDKYLEAYLRKTFESLLLSLLYKKNPDFQTRKKQLNRVLNPLCVKIKGANSQSEGTLWQLKKYTDAAVNVPTFEQLKEYVSEIPMPEIIYPKSETSQRGSSIKDADMKEYLLTLFDKAGGAIYEKQLNGLLNHIFDLNSVTFISDYGDKDGDSNYLEHMMNSREDPGNFIMYANDYMTVAKKCLYTMDEDIQQVIYYIFVQELSQGMVSKKIGKSDSAVSNIKKRGEKHIRTYIYKPSEFSPQEGQIILELIIELIREKRQVAA
ncbi:MAG: hypothetical protein HQK65_08655 [Desulfamplus sp.]|nr:hypothetical protein [Desulfamplus sp.]